MSLNRFNWPCPEQQHQIQYNLFGKVQSMSRTNATMSDMANYDITYGPDEERRTSTLSVMGNSPITTIYTGNYEERSNGDYLHYVYGPEGLLAMLVTKKNDATYRKMYYLYTDYLGSLTAAFNADGTLYKEFNYDPWGRKRNPTNWGDYETTASDPLFTIGFTGQEYIAQFALYNYNGRMYDPRLGRFLSPDNYVQDPNNSQNYNRYGYCLNNPLKYTDPSGEFITWSFSNGGFSIGFNLTPIGIPLGAGINIGWGDGASLGGYGEVGYRVGGTGFGSGVTVSQSLDYNFKHSGWSTATAEGAYASFGPFNAGINFSQTYDMSSKQWSNGWGVSAGVGIGNDASGIGFNVGYGSGGWTYGIGGYYNSHAWDSNPVYAPAQWNDGLNLDENGNVIFNTKQSMNNCYSYALDDIENGNAWGLQPREKGGSSLPRTDITLGKVTYAAISDGRIRKPTLLNKLGFGKRGYYSVYLVSADGVDYHWYRQDKGGMWSHKPGITAVVNVDASNPPRLITNPVSANHGIYNNGGTLLWVKRR